MYPQRAAIFLTIGVALALTPSLRQWVMDSGKMAAGGHAQKSYPSKTNERASGRPELSVLKQLAETVAIDDAAKLPPEKLAVACSTLDTDDLLEFLGDPRLWPREPSSSPVARDETELWIRLLRLAPLRKAALERLATLGLRRGILSFPSDAPILLTAAAKTNGARTFGIWNEIKEEWKLAEDAQGPDFFHDYGYIEGIGVIPFAGVDGPTAEQEALAALGKGWSSNDPDGAWAAVESGAFDRLSPKALASMIEGLGEKTDWRMWSERIGTLDWTMPSVEEVSSMSADPGTEAAVKLAQRWLESDAEEAIGWFSKVEGTWIFPQGRWPTNGFDLGGNGRQVFMSPWVPIYAAWLETDAGACFERLTEVAAPDDILADIVKWAGLATDQKVRVIGLVKDPALKDRLANAAALGNEAKE
jgi:hypothetical protein